MLKQQIKKQVAEVVSHSQCFDNPEVDKLIDTWLEAKRDFIEVFGGKTIWESPQPVTFKMSKEIREGRIDAFESYLVDQYGYDRLADFVEDNREGFFENQVIKNSQYENKKIPAGAKLIKSFKHFVHGDSALHDIQSRASQIVQEDSVTGILCFSVHPLDFLSSSENTYNWRSCHALDGEYRAGNLSYMCDKSTVICYLRGTDNTKLPMFPAEVPWNNKKWRMLLHFSDNWDVIFAGRQYPFESSTAMGLIRTYMLRLMGYDGDTGWCDWTDPLVCTVADSHNREYDLRDKYIMMRGKLVNLNDIIQEPPDPLHFPGIPAVGGRRCHGNQRRLPVCVAGGWHRADSVVYRESQRSYNSRYAGRLYCNIHRQPGIRRMLVVALRYRPRYNYIYRTMGIQALLQSRFCYPAG